MCYGIGGCFEDQLGQCVLAERIDRKKFMHEHDHSVCFICMLDKAGSLTDEQVAIREAISKEAELEE